MRALHPFGIGFPAGLAIAVVLGLGVASDAEADTAIHKAGRGLAAMTTSFLEVPGQMVVESRRNGLAYGVPVGFVKGLGGVVARELAGVFDFVTAPIEIPDDRRPILDPEYPWGYFGSDEGTRREGPVLGVRAPEVDRDSR